MSVEGNYNKPVLGHLCDGLDAWKSEDRDCYLNIGENGTIGSCDTDSRIVISYCPFCGIKLGESNVSSN